MPITLDRRHAVAGLAAALTLSLASVDAASANTEVEAWSPLATADSVAALGDTALLIDIRKPDAYAAGHVPGAVSAPYPTWRGPKENPGQQLSDAALTERLQSLGVTEDTRAVVVHQGIDATDFGAAARVYWTLKAAGLPEIAILNGGVNAWTASGRALSTDAVTPGRSDIVATLDPALTADRAAVAALSSGERAGQLIDARPLPFYVGATQHKAAAAAGTIEGAAQLQHDTWFGTRSSKITTDSAFVQEILDRSGAAPASGEEVAVFCNTGHWAATTWFALSEIAGVDNVRLYPGSLVDWTGAGAPVVNGAEQGG